MARSITVVLLTLSLTTALCDCSHRSDSIPADGTPRGTASTSASTGQEIIDNKFAHAIGKRLRDQDVDAYIDPSVTGNDRLIAHKLMRLMPSSRRGDFLYYDGKRVLSNNLALASKTKLEERVVQLASAMPSRGISPASGRRSPKSFINDGCSPPDPYPGTGPYTRNVSRCGFAGGWGIVFIPCGTTRMYDSRDNGYLYWELRGAGGNLYEAGMFTHTGGSDINPYLSASFGNYTLNNYYARYACGNYLGLMAGVVNAYVSQYPTVYVAMGNVPNYNPSDAFKPTEEVTMQNAAWIFMTAQPDMDYPGIDRAGVQTPCYNCSISKVTSIAQQGGDRADFSYFGVDNNGNDAIHWLEIRFGEWQPGCQEGALCTIVYSPRQDINYAGEENYPSPNQADAQFGQNGQAYESFDGAEAQTGVSPSSRHPAGAFVSAAPPTCLPDGYGYCVAYDSGPYGGQIQGLDSWGMNCGYYPQANNLTEDYTIMTGSFGTLRTYTSTWVDDGSGTCTTVQQWSPAEPSQADNDPNLP